VGHLAFGYVSSKTSARLLKTQFNIPLVLMLSIIPDIDILFPFLQHRGPTHSLIAASIVFIPIFAVYRKRAIPYLIALVQHSLVGDYIAGGRVQLLWPITTQDFGTSIDIRSPISITLEWVMFLTFIIVMLKTKDTVVFFQPHNSNLILSIPTFTVLLPPFLGFPLDVPISLIPPHIFYILLFSASIIIDLSKVLKNI
jgi:membrane-bound metal-dependent hydrolase YbcI (DUF457 family)